MLSVYYRLHGFCTLIELIGLFLLCRFMYFVKATINKELQSAEKIETEKRRLDNMTELQVLTEQRDNLLLKIKEIETSCEGIENEENANRLQELNAAKAQLLAQENNMQSQLSAIQAQIAAVSLSLIHI